MQLFYLSAFLKGLVLGVYAMIRGVERVGIAGRAPDLDAMGRPIGVPRMALTAPIVGAFTTVLGITGYLLWRYTEMAAGMQLAIGLSAALVGTVLATTAVARWAKQAATHDAVEERYLLQGHPAQVTASIGETRAGEIGYLVGGRSYATVAQSLDGTPIAAGTEVVIDRVEDGVAYVEPWVQVEQRL